jgi:hypothetical protein
MKRQNKMPHKNLSRREAMVKWLRQMAHEQEIMGSNPGTVYWMEVNDASY